MTTVILVGVPLLAAVVVGASLLLLRRAYRESKRLAVESRASAARAEEAAARVHEAWLETATDRELLEDAMRNPIAVEAGRASAELNRRFNARMRGGHA